ncbi:hypothetical protein BC828DRAFT_395710 [Blastocladiella britannica]|nr:hypothetical protein BC828DRAFT_395710 [Blastocladiella britannica]
MSVIPTGQPLNITWKWKNVVIYPTMLSLEISAPPATSGKLAGSTLKTPLNQWFPVCINFTASSSTASYLWQVNMTAAAGYTLRLYDSTVGPNYSVQPGRLAMSTSSKFNLYLPGTNNNLIVALSDGSPSWARIGTGQVFAVLFSVAVLGVLV